MKKVVLFFVLLNFVSLAVTQTRQGTFANTQPPLTKNYSDSLWNVWLTEALPDTVRLTALYQYTWSAFSQGNPDSLFHFAQIQFDFADSRGLKTFTASALNMQGIACTQKGETENSILFYSKSLTINSETGNQAGIIKSLTDLAKGYLDLGDYLMAIDFYEQSIKLQEHAGNKKLMIATYNSLGVAHMRNGDYSKALACYSLSLALSDEIQEYSILGKCYGNIGIAYMMQGLSDVALDYFNKAMIIFQESENKSGISSLQNNIGIIYKRNNEFEIALDYFQKSLTGKLEINDQLGVANALNNIGNTLHGLGKNEDALVYLLQSLKLREEIDHTAGQIESWLSIGRFYERTSNPEKALNAYKSAMQLALTLDNPELLLNASRDIFRCYAINHNLDDALPYLYHLNSSVKRLMLNNYFSLSEREKEIYFMTLENDLGRYYECALFYNNKNMALVDTAFNIALQTKGLTLKSSTALRNSVINSHDSLLISDYTNWIQLKRKISVTNSNSDETKDLLKRVNELEKELIQRSGYFGDLDKIKNLDWKQVRDGLKEGEAVIEFVHFKSEIDTANPVIYAAFVVRPDSEHPDMVRLCTETDLKNILGVLQGNDLSFIERVYGRKADAKNDLYQKIWQPLEPYLKDVITVYYSPSGLLHKVSFAAICKEQNVFLSDVYHFRQMGSTGNLAFENNTAFGELENFLLMGGINYSNGLSKSNSEVWSYLPGSLTETDAINTYLQKKKFGVNYFNGQNASEEIFKEKISSSSIVHIATHGFFFPDPEQVRAEMQSENENEGGEIKFRGTTNYANWSFVNNKNPLMRSGIVLANANDVWQRDPLTEGEDGVLTAQEVSTLDLRNTKLVVLSACETGLGDIKGSEGVYGLQRAFKMAGVKYLIMSLWQVPDKETSEFMILFYKNLLRVKDIPLAFQKTQKVMREKYDPYYWGAFVLIE